MPEDELDREAILARRRRFITASLAGVATGTLATACPCLDVAPRPPAETDGDTEGGDTDGETEGDTDGATTGVDAPSGE